MYRFLGTLIFLTLASLSLQRSYDPNLAFEMLRGSSAAYCNSDQLQNMQCDVCHDLQGYTFVTQYTYTINSWESCSYSMFVNPSKKRFITSFRGTSTKTQLLDEITNSGYTSYKLYNVPGAVSTYYFYNHYVNNLRDDFMGKLKTALASYSDYEYFFVGHSLGGAFTTLAILDVSLGGIIPKDRLHMYNYGSPRVGNINFAQAVAANVAELYRVVHYEDIVPHVPPCMFGIHGQCLTGSSNDVPLEDGQSQDPNFLYYAWHVSPEIFYSTEDSSTYTVCAQDEDATCADQFEPYSLSIADHLLYLGVGTGCNGNTAFPTGNNQESRIAETMRDQPFVEANSWIFL